MRHLLLRPAHQGAAALAQTRHTGPLDDSRVETEIRQVRDAPVTSTPGARRALSVPARAWLAVGAAATIWLLVALILLILL